MERPLVLIHTDCGKPAYRMLRKPMPYDYRSSRDALHLDGSKLEPCERFTCGSCGERFTKVPQTKDVRTATPAEWRAIQKIARSAAAKKGWETRRGAGVLQLGPEHLERADPRAMAFIRLDMSGASPTTARPDEKVAPTRYVDALPIADPNPWPAIAAAVKQGVMRVAGWLRP